MAWKGTLRYLLMKIPQKYVVGIVIGQVEALGEITGDTEELVEDVSAAVQAYRIINGHLKVKEDLSDSGFGEAFKVKVLRKIETLKKAVDEHERK